VRPHNSLASRLGLDDPLVSPMRFLGFPPQRGTKLNILLDSLLEQGDMASAASSSHCVNQHRGEPNDRNSLANLFLTVSSCMFCHMVPAVHGGSFRLATTVLGAGRLGGECGFGKRKTCDRTVAGIPGLISMIPLLCP